MIWILHIELVNPMWMWYVVNPLSKKRVQIYNCEIHFILQRYFTERKVYHRKKSLIDVRLKVDLTKKRQTLLLKVNVKNIPKVKFCYADINCFLNVK